MKTEDTDALGS